MASAGSIFVDLLLRDSQYRDGLKRSTTATQAATRTWQRDVDKASAAFKQLGGIIITTVASRALIGNLKSVADRMDDIGKASDRLAIATESLSKMAFAGELAGVSTEDLEKAVKKMQQTIVFASDGLATYTRVFDTLGLKVKDVIDLKPEDAFNRLLTALLAIENPTIRNARAVDLFGRAGLKLINFAGEGSKSLQELYTEAERLGVVFDREAAAKAERFNDSLVRVKNAYDGLIISFIDRGGLDGVAAALEGLAENMDTIASAVQLVATVFATRFTVSMVAATASMLAATRQAVLYQVALARMAGISASTAVAVTALSRALAIVGGPIGVAIIAVGTAIYALSSATDEAEDSTDKFNTALEKARELHESINPKYAEAAKNIGEQRDAQIEAARAAIQNTQALIEQNKALTVNNALTVARTGLAPEQINTGAITELNNQLEEQKKRLQELVDEINNTEINIQVSGGISEKVQENIDKINEELALLQTENQHYGESEKTIDAIVRLKKLQLELQREGEELTQEELDALRERLNLLANEKEIADQLKEATQARAKFDDILRNLREETQLLAIQNDHFGENKNQVEAIVELQRIQNQLAEAGVTLSGEDLNNLKAKLNLLVTEKNLQDDLQEAEAARVKAQEELQKKQEEKQKLFEESIQRIKEDLASEITDAIKGAKSLGDAFKNVAANIAEAVTKAQILKLLSSTGLGSGSGGGGGGGFLGGLFSGGGIFDGLLNSFDVGTPYVPKDQIAEIHEGEMIIPKMQADAIRKGQAGNSITMNIYTQDANSFARSQQQILTQTQQLLARAQRRNG